MPRHALLLGLLPALVSATALTTSPALAAPSGTTHLLFRPQPGTQVTPALMRSELAALRKRLKLAEVPHAVVSQQGAERVTIDAPAREAARVVRLVSQRTELLFLAPKADYPQGTPLPSSWKTSQAAGWVRTGVDGSMIQDAGVNRVDGHIVVMFELNKDGKRKLNALTRQMQGKLLGVFVDDRKLMAPKIHGENHTGIVTLDAKLSDEEASDLADALAAGPLPFPLQQLKGAGGR